MGRDGVRFRKDRGRYEIQWTDANGKRHRRMATGQYLKDARNEKHQLESGTHPSQQPRTTSPEFSQVAQEFLEYQQPRVTPKAFEREAGIVKHLIGFFSGPLDTITPAKVSSYITVRLGEVSRGSVKKEFTSLRHLFRLATGEWKLLPRASDPTLDVKAPTVHDARNRYLMPAEFRLLLENCQRKYRPILLTATGMRRSELLTRRWMDVTEQSMSLPRSKNGESRYVILNQFARQVLDSLPPGLPGERLFPDVTPEGVSLACLRAARRAGIHDFRLHDCRHTFASWLRQKGTSLDIIGDLLGHKDLRMTKRYAAIGQQQLQNAANLLDSVLANVLDTPNSASDATTVPPEPQAMAIVKS
jgi:integrase